MKQSARPQDGRCSVLKGGRVARKKESMVKECWAYVTFKDGSAHIAKYNLQGNLPFTESEMAKWIKEDSWNIENKAVESVSILHPKKGN